MTGLEIIAAGAAVLSAAGSIIGGFQEAAAQEAQAEAFEQQAAHEQRRARLEADDFRRRNSRILAAQRARFGAAGVQRTGSPLLLASDVASDIELQAMRLINQGDVNATRLRNQAGFAQSQAQSARIAGIAGAGQSLLSGASNFGSLGGGTTVNPQAFNQGRAASGVSFGTQTARGGR